MIDVLEDKVSELIAENGTLKLHNIQLQKDFEKRDKELENLRDHIKYLSQEIEKTAKENHHLQQILQKEDDSKISVYQYEQVKTALDMAQSQLVS